MRVYLSGPISNDPHYRKKFNAAEDELSHQGYEVINPVKVSDAFTNLTYGEYMKIDLALLEICDAIHMLDGWEESAGARIEYHFAMMWEKQIVI